MLALDLWEHDISVDLGYLAVHICECYAVPLGPIRPHDLKELNDRDFDQAIVVNAKGDLIGGITAWRLEDLRRNNQELSQEEAVSGFKEIHNHCSLDVLLEFLSASKFGFIVEEHDAEQLGTYASVLGLLTIADLNKRYFRSLLYMILAEIEMAFAGLIMQCCTDPNNKWLEKLGDDSLRRILGFWQLSKFRNVEVDPIEYCNLTDLLVVTKKNPEIGRILGNESSACIKRIRKQLPEWRNRVMHPVRPLITSQGDIAALRNVLADIYSLGKRIYEIQPKSR